MTNRTLLTWLLLLGAFVWLSAKGLDSHPTYAVVAVLAVLVFSTFAVRSNPNYTAT
jgi:pheromone shutdown protein TraB